MSLPLKAGIGLVTVGTIGGVGYGIVAYSQDKGTEISKLIEEEFQYKLLDTTDGQTNPTKEKWAEVWKKYKDDGKNAFNLIGWIANKGDLDLTEKLKEKCKELSTTKVLGSKDNTYVNVTKYCSRGVTFAEQAKKDKLTILDTSGSDHSTIWADRHTKKVTINDHLDKLDIKGDINNGDAIKSGCGKAKEYNKQVANYEIVYQSYKLICTKQNGDK